ncbi:type III secretion system protein SctP [Burkholderia vietnamiensis]|nr:type III secretion system protein SctP [Burkholderia vietnamiensis]
MADTIVNPRIIPGDAHGEPDEMAARRPAAATPRSGIDYAALVGRARRRNEYRSGRPSRPPFDDRHDPHPDAPALAPATDDNASLADEANTAEPGAPRLSELAAPFLAALSDQQARVARLMHFLADKVVDFCTDDAVVAHGNWTIRMRIDSGLLPECTLHLTLSHFDLVLRFETSSEPVRALICRHEDTLKQRLVSLLAHMQMSREVAIETP